jgi:hypothetical protein
LNNNYDPLASLKDKEFSILKKLTSNDMSENERNKLIKELEQVRAEITKLG